MILRRFADGLKSNAARFARAERGNVALMFAIILPVLLGAIGTAIDYSRAANARSAMQAAVDATALMISKDAAGLSQEDLTKRAQAYFNALYTHSEVSVAPLSASYTANSGSGASVTLTVTGAMPTDFMKLASITSMPMSASSTTKWGNIRYRVALALDNTGSMDSANKMVELKSAATKLIEDFYAMAGTNEDVYISIVPFAKDVNIGKEKKNESWMSWTDWDANNTQGVCTKSQYTSRRRCQDNGGTWQIVAQSHDNWNGCVMDRNEPEDTTSTTPDSAVTATKIPAEQYDSCPVQMLGMTSVKASKQVLLDKITAMAPLGGTNQQIGMFWAWHTLLLTGPFPAPPKDANYVYQDVIILLTDGLNTQNRVYGNGYQHSPEVDARQKILCTTARDQGIKIFAIQVSTENGAVSTETKNCVSEPNNPNYFSYITQASQMTVKFQNIFKELAKLRVSS